ncbi:hypothetical protein [Ornithinimicrobium kibberense]|uniref:hypothetical protein n=1 Tax=Ornithinimicrobium kibberense TaxID=282060 RepID=UPI00361D3F41
MARSKNHGTVMPMAPATATQTGRAARPAVIWAGAAMTASVPKAMKRENASPNPRSMLQDWPEIQPRTPPISMIDHARPG